MKIVDLLNKKANGEEIPKKIKYKDNIFIAKGDRINGFIDYVCEELDYCFFHYIDWDALNDEVEIIEEDKKDEEIEIYVNGKEVDITDIYEPLKQGEYIYKENGKWYVHKLKNVSFVIEEDKRIEKIETYDKDGNIFIDEQCFKYVPIDKHCLTANEQVFVDKINKVIDYMNKEK